MLEEKEAAEGAERQAKIGRGDRSEKIRTYNYPQNRVTDHRIGLTLNKLDKIMAGDLDEIIEALKNTDFNIVEIPQDQNFKSATIFRKTIQQQGAKTNTLEALKKLADLLR